MQTNEQKLRQLLHNNSLDGITIMHAAPVLTGIKPSGLFCVPLRPHRYKQWAAELKGAGLCICPLHACKTNISVLLYCPKSLSGVLRKKEAQSVLKKCGYPQTSDLKVLLCHLKTRYTQYIKQNISYPHEVGIFLGYPIDDVLDFMHNIKPCRMVRYWKVYNCVDYANNMAMRYDKARETVLADYLKGKSLSQITRAST